VAPIYGLLFQQLIDLNVRELPSGNTLIVRRLWPKAARLTPKPAIKGVRKPASIGPSFGDFLFVITISSLLEMHCAPQGGRIRPRAAVLSHEDLR
ncbi:hypothetical protein, partial [Sphingomonas sp. NPDC049708]|uniref:hypothetical protein n=1 Tax=Sphingomonas sp. NPDC049708 TaxID=3390681 RepID=UPI003D0637AC